MAVGFRSSSIRSASDSFSSSVNIPVPSGATTGDIVICFVGQWDSSGFGTVTPPAGFTLVGEATHITPDSRIRVSAFWKRLTTSDAGTYNFSLSFQRWSNGNAICLTGGLASGDPIEGFDTGGTSGTSYPALAVTTVTEPFLAWGAYNDPAATTTVPTGYTEIQVQDPGTAAWDIPATTGSQSASGATVSVSGVLAAILVAVAAEGGATTVLGSIDATFPALASDAGGEVTVSGADGLTLGSLTSSFDGLVGDVVSGALESPLPALSADLTGESSIGEGHLAATFGALQSGFVAAVGTEGPLDLTLPPLSSSFDGTLVGTIAGAIEIGLPSLSATFAGGLTPSGVIDITLPSITSEFTVPPPRVFSLQPPAEDTGVYDTKGLFRYFTFPMSIALLKREGTWELEGGVVSLDDVEKYYLGGYQHILDEQEGLELIDAGFGQFLSEITEDGDLVPQSTQNPGFEYHNMNGWQALSGRLIRTNDRSHTGSYSALLIPDGSSTVAVAETTVAAGPAISGVEHEISGWLYSPNGWSAARLLVTWYENVTETEFGPIVELPAAQWTFLSFTATAPSAATRGRWRMRLEDSPTPDDVVFIDDVAMERTGS